MADLEIIGLRELQAAIARNPKMVLDEGRSFLTRGMAKYKSGIINNPWRIGGTGGGAPVANDPRYQRKYQRSRSGNLRDTHETQITSLQAIIRPTASYAKFVHFGTKYMEARPWLDYVKKTQDGAIRGLYEAMLQRIVADLAK